MTFIPGFMNLVIYERPNLNFRTVTEVDVDANFIDGTSTTTTVLFPDGSFRTVTEDTSSSDKFRRFNITAVAEFTSGTEDSGLFSGTTETANTWYAIYAVKSLINNDNFVLVGDDVFPSQTNKATLDSNFGTNSWVFLGYIRNGDSGSTTSDILNFAQAGPWMYFQNTATSLVYGGTGMGIQMASTGGATSLTYSATFGSGDTDIPTNTTIALWNGARNAPGAGRDFLISRSTGVAVYRTFSSDREMAQVQLPASLGLNLISSTTAVTMDILLTGYYDATLERGKANIL